MVKEITPPLNLNRAALQNSTNFPSIRNNGFGFLKISHIRVIICREGPSVLEPVGSRQNLKSNRKPPLNVCSVKWTMGRKGVNWGPKSDPPGLCDLLSVRTDGAGG